MRPIPAELARSNTGSTKSATSEKQSDGEEVGFKAYIRNVNNIDTEKQKFFVDIWLCAYTSDVNSATEAFQNCYQHEKHEEYFNGKQRPPWTLTFLNAEDARYIYMEKNLPTVRKFDDGTFFERQHVQGYISQSLDLRYFPFDSQVLEIKISLDVCVNVAKFIEDKMSISVDKDGNWKKVMGLTEWNILEKPTIQVFDRDVSSGEEVLPQDHLTQRQGANRYSTVVIRIKVSRNSSYYVNGMIIPLFVIIVASLLVFFMYKQGEIDEHMSYLSTLLLAIIAVRWSFIEKMPKVPYLCFMDQLFLIATLLVLCIMIMLVCLQTEVTSSMILAFKNGIHYVIGGNICVAVVMFIINSVYNTRSLL